MNVTGEPNYPPAMNPDIEKMEKATELLPPPEALVCPKCAGQNLRKETQEIIVFRHNKAHGVLSAKPGHAFHICRGCGNVIAREDDVNMRLLNRAERRRYEANRRKGGK